MTKSLEKTNVLKKDKDLNKATSGRVSTLAEKTLTSKKKKKTLRVGDVCVLKISALAPNNIGIDEYSYPYAIFVPNAKYGSEIKAKILKIQVKDSTYAVAQLIEEFKSTSSASRKPTANARTEGASSEGMETAQQVRPGDSLTVSITKKLGENAGIVEFPNNFRLIVPLEKGASLASLENVKVTVTRVKAEYGFAKREKGDLKETPSNNSVIHPFGSAQKNKLALGSKFTTTLPLKSKQYGKFLVFKVNGSILFLKFEKGVNLGDKVRIKVTSTSSNCAVGQILKVNPGFQKPSNPLSLSLLRSSPYGETAKNVKSARSKKASLVINSIREMINHGMHFGEKAVKCHARMKNYIWLKKQGQNKNRPLIKKGRHIINLLKTRRCLNQALNKLTKYALKGRTFLFIGTKKPAAGLVARASFFTKNSFYVNTRWLGGMLTNWKTICKSISKIRPILKEKQKVVRDILERRQSIKSRLIKKALLLRKKSKIILSKGRALLETFKNPNKRAEITLRAQKLTALRNELLTKGMNYLEKRQKLVEKRRELIYQTLLLKEKGLLISSKHKALLNQLAIYAKKLREYKYLLILTTELQNLKNSPSSQLVSVSYNKFKEVNQQLSNSSVGGEPPTSLLLSSPSARKRTFVPNPPKEILNRIVLTMKNQYDNDSLIGAKSTAGAATGNKKILVCSTLLSKFSRFSSYIKTVIKTLLNSIQSLEKQSQKYSSDLNQIQATLKTYLTLKQKYIAELQQLKVKLTNERSVIRIVKRKFKSLDAYKKLIKFLPRLRYLPTPQTKISEIVQILLSRIVDPKLKYPIETIYDQKLSTSSKKLAAARKKKWQRLEKYFGGIANMTKLTKTQISRNVAIIIGQKEEINAVRECHKLGIKTFTIVDTNCNPTLSDHVIPANDDSRNSIKYILTKLITRIRLAQKLRSRLLPSSLGNQTAQKSSKFEKRNFSKQRKAY
jgi:small subunit ribosomal protein S2